jgi:hypothetical protein
MPEDIEGLLPKLTGLVEPRVELQLHIAFRRLYEYMNYKLKEYQKAMIAQTAKSSEDIQASQNEFNSLIGVLSNPLVGSSVQDPLLQSIVQSFGPQAANSVFAGPEPAFKPLTVSYLPNGIPLSKLDTKILKTDDNLNKTVGAPVADGYIVIKDNNGNSVKVITTA